VLPAGADTKLAVTDIESSTCDDKNVSVATADVDVAVSPVSCEAVADERVKESEKVIACEGTTDKRPKPNAATVPSATRLNVVFVRNLIEERFMRCLL
jgi:hypothetical protein